MPPQTTRLTFADLDGWDSDDHGAGLAVFLLSAHGIVPTGDPKVWIERNFQPTLFTDDRPALFTGYYEPELIGSRVRSNEFSVPLHVKPANMGTPWLTRREIDQTDALRGHELVWLRDPLDRFFLQVQGSGRIQLIEGGQMRVGYDGTNGHPYASLGKEMIRLGHIPADVISPQAIRDWFAQYPDQLSLLWHNASYVFFRAVTEVPADSGPIGTMGVSVTAGRTIAVDPDITPLGAMVWLEKHGAQPFSRLMVAQDTGSAIKGAQRADIFVGTGPKAGHIAGGYRDSGRMVVLLPKEQMD